MIVAERASDAPDQHAPGESGARRSSVLSRVMPGPGLSVGVAAVLLTALLWSVVYALQTRFFEHYPYFFDHVWYSYYNVSLYTQAMRDGLWKVGVHEWLTNYRSPLRTAPLVLLAPELLASQLGFLATAIPFIGCLLGLLGLYVYRRTGSLPYALAAMALYVAVPGHLNPYQGVGAYWLEIAASPLLGSAVLCLLLSNGGRHLGWLAAFAMFASLACLSRYVTVAFVVVLCAPIVVVFLGRRYWLERSLLRSLLLPILVIGTVTGLLAARFLIVHLQGNVLFYSNLGPVGQGHWNAVEFTAEWAYRYTGQYIMGVLALAAITVLMLALLRGRFAWGSLVLSLWVALAVPLFLAYQGAAEARHIIWVVLPPLFTALLVPVPIPALSRADRRDRQGRPWVSMVLLGLAIVVTGVAVWVFSQTATTAWRTAGEPPPPLADQKALDVQMADLLAAQGDRLVWNSYVDDYAWTPTLETFFRTRRLILPAGTRFYQHHGTQWAWDFPNMTPEQIAQQISDGTTRLVDIALVFDNPGDAETAATMNNPYSRTVSRAVSEMVRTNPAWERVAVIETKSYGRVAVYRNHASNGIGFDTALLLRLRPDTVPPK